MQVEGRGMKGERGRRGEQAKDRKATVRTPPMTREQREKGLEAVAKEPTTLRPW